MASLESLSNPLERLGVLPTAMCARFIGTSLVWSAAVQYFKNDVVVSGVDGGAYVCEVTSVLGGSDPSAAPASWTRLAPTGIRNTTQIAVPSTLGAANSITLPAGATLTGLPAGSTWLVNVQGSLTTAIATLAADVTTFTFTPNGAGALVWRTEVAPIANTTSLITDFGQSGVVVVGTGGSTITPTATYTGAAPTLVGTIVYTRVS
jgi:hypothetical protein